MAAALRPPRRSPGGAAGSRPPAPGQGPRLRGLEVQRVRAGRGRGDGTLSQRRHRRGASSPARRGGDRLRRHPLSGPQAAAPAGRRTALFGRQHVARGHALAAVPLRCEHGPRGLAEVREDGHLPHPGAHRCGRAAARQLGGRDRDAAPREARLDPARPAGGLPRGLRGLAFRLARRAGVHPRRRHGAGVPHGRPGPAPLVDAGARDAARGRRAPDGAARIERRRAGHPRRPHARRRALHAPRPRRGVAGVRSRAARGHRQRGPDEPQEPTRRDPPRGLRPERRQAVRADRGRDRPRRAEGDLGRIQARRRVRPRDARGRTGRGTMMATVNVQELIDSRKLSGFQVMVVSLCALIVLIDGFDTQAIGYVAPAIVRSWHVDRASLTPVFSAGLFGLMLGALAFGPIADRFGRKPVLLFCTLFFGVMSLLTLTADSVKSLMVLRFITGLGLGGAMPNAIALTTEYAPRRIRATTVMIMFCGFSLGAALGGVAAASLITHFGWKAVFLLGGVVPCLAFGFVAALLPESIRYLVVQGGRGEKVAAILSRIDPAAAV